MFRNGASKQQSRYQSNRNPTRIISPGLEDENGLAVPDGVASDLPLSGLEAAVGERLEAQSGTVVGSGLLGVAHPPLDVVELQELAAVRLGTLQKRKNI